MNSIIPNCYVDEKPNKSKTTRRRLSAAPVEVQEAAKMHRATQQPPLQPKVITEEDRICHNCLTKATNAASVNNDDDKVEFNVLAQRSREQCFICEKRCNNRISFQARINKVPQGTRLCCNHYNDDGIYLGEELLQGLSYVKRKIYVPLPELQKWIVALGKEVRTTKKRRFNDETDFTEDGFKTFTSLTKHQFNDLFSYCKPVELYRVKNRRISKKDLLMFIAKLRQGLSDDFLCVMFKYSTRQAVSLAVAKVRKSLMENFVPNYLGVGALTRQQYIDRHVTDFTNELYNPTPDIKAAIVYIDGTYIQVPKMSCYRILRQSFCTHKGYHLVKPIMNVAPDGYILDVHGPYFSDGKNNDAACLKEELEKDIQGFRTWLQENDIFIVDRGYRDAIEYLETLGIRSEMLSYLRKGNKQHTTEEANKSRLITNTRWIVEARNGHVKGRFRFFGQMVDVHHLPNIGDFFRIACSIINAYHPLIHMQGATVERARLMLDRANNAVNVVQQRVEEDRLHLASGSWFPMQHAHVPAFPRLSLEYLRDITLGIYQLRLARSYVQDKCDRESEYEFEVNLEIPGLLRVRTCSRHVNSVNHRFYIAYDEQDFEQSIGEPPPPMPLEEPILGWYCKCKAGARTVGCCAHVASVLWYLGYARHEPNIRYPSHKGLEVIRDAGNRPMPQLLDPPNLIAGLIHHNGNAHNDVYPENNIQNEENNVVNPMNEYYDNWVQQMQNNVLHDVQQHNNGVEEIQNNILNPVENNNNGVEEIQNNILNPVEDHNNVGLEDNQNNILNPVENDNNVGLEDNQNNILNLAEDDNNVGLEDNQNNILNPLEHQNDIGIEDNQNNMNGDGHNLHIEYEYYDFLDHQIPNNEVEMDLNDGRFINDDDELNIDSDHEDEIEDSI